MPMKRIDVMMDQPMIDATDEVARRRGLTRSGLIKGVLARELTAELGAHWYARQPDDQQADV